MSHFTALCHVKAFIALPARVPPAFMPTQDRKSTKSKKQKVSRLVSKMSSVIATILTLGILIPDGADDQPAKKKN